jgi:hypothetical protein
MKTVVITAAGAALGAAAVAMLMSNSGEAASGPASRYSAPMNASYSPSPGSNYQQAPGGYPAASAPPSASEHLNSVQPQSQLPNSDTCSKAGTFPSDRSLGPAPYNRAVLDAIRKVPANRGFSRNAAALPKIVHADGANIQVDWDKLGQSKCSDAGYLAFIGAIQGLQKEGLRLDPAVVQRLADTGGGDGVGVAGRFLANGPGIARLFTEANIGRNFTSLNEALPGDFVKIFWNDQVGVKESGHTVVFTGVKNGNVCFWSSNDSTNGAAEKCVPQSKINNMVFSRIENAGNVNCIADIKPADPWLVGLKSGSSSYGEMCQKVACTSVSRAPVQVADPTGPRNASK